MPIHLVVCNDTATTHKIGKPWSTRKITRAVSKIALGLQDKLYLGNKIHFGKCLGENNWDAIRADLNKRPIEGIDGSASEKEILEKLEKYGLRTVIQSNNRTIAHSHNRTNVSVEIWGSGAPMREFLWSEEMADAFVFVMENVNFTDLRNNSHHNSQEIRNTHINIGTGKEISIKDLAHLIKETIDFKGDLVFNTEKPDGTMRKLTDPSKLHSLGWHHKIEVEEGVRKLYDWYLS